MKINYNVAPHLRDRILEIALHEAGHYIVARSLDFYSASISIEIKDYYGNHNAGCAVDLTVPLKSKDDIINYLENRIKILYAGSLAEALNYKGISSEEGSKKIKESGKSDCDKARENIHLLRNILFPEDIESAKVQEELDEIEERLWNETIRLVESNAEIIEILGRRLTQLVTDFTTKYELLTEDINKMKAIKDKFHIT